MTDLATARHQLVMANRILANEGILDAFGPSPCAIPSTPIGS